MKKNICFNQLPVFMLIMAFLLGFSSTLKSQEITTYQYRHVDPANAAAK